VVWREQSSIFLPAILVSRGTKTIIPDHKLMFIPFRQEDEAYFIGGLLRSSVTKLLVKSSSIETQISTKVIANVALPRFQKDNALHSDIATTSRAMEKTISSGKTSEVIGFAETLDQCAAKLWGITAKELAQVQRALKED
jgi:hypothetical protein